MKKKLYFMTLAILMAAMCLTTGCSKDDDKDNNSEKTAYKIAGRWAITHARMDANEKWTEWAWGAFIRFGTDNTYATTFGNLYSSGTYTTEGVYIYVVLSKDEKQKYKVISATDYELELAYYDNDQATKPSVYYRLSRVPQTEDEAKKMMIGMWQGPLDPFYDFEEEYYIDFNTDGHFYEISKIKKNLTKEGKWYEAYQGQYVGYIYFKKFEIVPNSQDPTKGSIRFYNDGGGFLPVPYNNLTGISFIINDGKYTRTQSRIKYKLIDKPHN